MVKISVQVTQKLFYGGTSMCSTRRIKKLKLLIPASNKFHFCHAELK